jgi:two-component system response regulator HydG
MATVLIVDDNETLREGAASVVRKMGHLTLLAAKASDGIALFEKNQPEMVLTDLKMEGDDGLTLLLRVRDLDRDAVVMIMTGFGTVKVAVDAMKSGAFDFIEKPFSPDVLRAKVSSGLAVRDERKRFERALGLADAAAADAAERFTELASPDTPRAQTTAAASVGTKADAASTRAPAARRERRVITVIRVGQEPRRA